MSHTHRTRLTVEYSEWVRTFARIGALATTAFATWISVQAFARQLTSQGTIVAAIAWSFAVAYWRIVALVSQRLMVSDTHLVVRGIGGRLERLAWNDVRAVTIPRLVRGVLILTARDGRRWHLGRDMRDMARFLDVLQSKVALPDFPPSAHPSARRSMAATRSALVAIGVLTLLMLIQSRC